MLKSENDTLKVGEYGKQRIVQIPIKYRIWTLLHQPVLAYNTESLVLRVWLGRSWSGCSDGLGYGLGQGGRLDGLDDGGLGGVVEILRLLGDRLVLHSARRHRRLQLLPQTTVLRLATLSLNHSALSSSLPHFHSRTTSSPSSAMSQSTLSVQRTSMAVTRKPTASSRVISDAPVHTASCPPSQPRNWWLCIMLEDSTFILRTTTF